MLENKDKIKTSEKILVIAECLDLSQNSTEFLERFDEFIDLKYSEKYDAETKEEEMQSYLSKDDLSKIHAHRWALMALSRPIDTLVISLSDLEDETSRYILDLANQNKDFVEIL